MSAQPLQTGPHSYSEDEVVIVQRDGTRRVIRHRRYRVRPPQNEAAPPGTHVPAQG
jgi:hypothetical protein